MTGTNIATVAQYQQIGMRPFRTYHTNDLVIIIRNRNLLLVASSISPTAGQIGFDALPQICQTLSAHRRVAQRVTRLRNSVITYFQASKDPLLLVNTAVSIALREFLAIEYPTQSILPRISRA